MAYHHAERLSALDLSFLELETSSMHMHVGAVAIFDGAPALRTPEGALDIERLRAAIESSLQASPRFRQKLATVPLFELPVWIDDDRFNLAYHVRHAALPRPGNIRLLKRLAGRVFSQKLDRGKPQWEFWFVEGLEDGRFALIAKAHHCMVDGISGLDLLAGIMRPDPDPSVTPAKAFLPRPPPSGARLLLGELGRRATLPLSLAGGGARLLSQPRQALTSLIESGRAIGEALSAGLQPASPTPLNPDIGPYRRFDWTRFDLDAVKEVKSRLGGTVNDVVLACVSGAVARFLKHRGMRVADLRFRAMVPVSVRSAHERDLAGNKVVSLVAPLPLEEKDPRRRLARVSETTTHLKRSRMADGIRLFEEVTDRISATLFVQLVRMAGRARSYNLVVTNVPGPPVPAYLIGARMREVYPLVPLFENQALGIALFSYDGGLYWGFNADWEAVPDLHDLVEAVEREFEALRKAALEGPLKARGRGRRGRAKARS